MWALTCPSHDAVIYHNKLFSADLCHAGKQLPISYPIVATQQSNLQLHPTSLHHDLLHQTLLLQLDAQQALHRTQLRRVDATHALN